MTMDLKTQKEFCAEYGHNWIEAKGKYEISNYVCLECGTTETDYMLEQGTY